jgi:hypothetical protein
LDKFGWFLTFKNDFESTKLAFFIHWFLSFGKRYESDLTNAIFETGASGVPSKSQKSFICDGMRQTITLKSPGKGAPPSTPSSHSRMGHYFFSYLVTWEVDLIEIQEIMPQLWQNVIFLSLKPTRVTSDFILN